MSKEVIVTWTATFKTKLTVDEKATHAEIQLEASDIDPLHPNESGPTDYVANSWEIKEVEIQEPIIGKPWQIETFMLLGGWTNVDTETDEHDVEIPMMFACREDALADLQTHFNSVAEAVAMGNMSSMCEVSDYRIRNVRTGLKFAINKLADGTLSLSHPIPASM